MLDTKDFGRIAAQTAKHVISQGISDAEKGQIRMEFQSKQQELVTAKVLSVDPVSYTHLGQHREKALRRA